MQLANKFLVFFGSPYAFGGFRDLVLVIFRTLAAFENRHDPSLYGCYRSYFLGSGEK